MNIITNIMRNAGKNGDRVYVYIDKKYCVSIRERTFVAMQLKIGDQISCNDLQEKENFFWKNQYKNTWEDEKYRLQRVITWLNCYIPSAEVEITGFGANSTEIIKSHPEEHGEPDLTIYINNKTIIVLALEVSGTKFMRGQDYWVRPDKIDFVQNHPEIDVWIALHYQIPKEKIVWIKPEKEKKYKPLFMTIRGAREKFVTFNDSSREVKTSQYFKDYVDGKVAALKDSDDDF